MEACAQCTPSRDWNLDVDVGYKREENRDIFDGNLSRLQNEGKLWFYNPHPKKRDTADEKTEQFWEKQDGWQL